MARIVFVHGVGQQVKGPLTVHGEVLPALADGLAPTGVRLRADDLTCAFYGDLFRPAAEVLAPEPYLDADDLTEQERDLLAEWWRRAAEADPTIVRPDVETLARTPNWARAAVRALSGSAFFADIAERAMLGSLRQVRRYFAEPEIREVAIDAVLACLTEDTRVVVAHSLGSVVAYETLATRSPGKPVALVTLGSPLGLRRLIFDRLRPAPSPDGAPPGRWPGGASSWTNVVDHGDVVASADDLKPLFGDAVRHIRVHNGAKAHDVRPYLTERLTGAAIAEGLLA